jgi:hypothetical protein
MTRAQRVLRFLVSRKNIGATLLALGGVALMALGFTAGLVGVGVIVGVYAAAYLLIPKERGVALTLFDERDSRQIREGLNELLHSIRFRVSPDVERAIEDVVRSIILTLPPEETQGISAIDPTVMLIRQTALHYVPKVLSDYLAIPRMYAERVAIQDGKTAKDVLIEQLRMIEEKMKETSLAMYRTDADRLLANARFLQERFQHSVFEKVPAVDLGFDTHEDTWRPR